MENFNNNFFPEGDGVGHYLEGRVRGTQIGGELGEFMEGYGGGDNNSKEFIRPPAGNKFLRNTGLFSAFCLFVLLGRAASLQISQGEEYRSLAEGNRLRKTMIQAERGIIADRNGRLLVQNVPTFSIYAVPRDLPKTFGEKEAALRTLSE